MIRDATIMADPVIRLERITKRYGPHKAVDDLSLSVPRGSVFGFLGLNGAGKSTTIGMMLRLLRPTSGRIEFFGLDLAKSYREIAARTGALLEQPSFHPHLSGRRNLEWLARASGTYDRSQVDAWLDRMRLGDAATRRAGTYSQGMRQALGIAAAFLREPEVVVLDEPTNSLDPEAVQNFRDLVHEQTRKRGTTFFISSHLLHEVETLCDTVAILREGKLVVAGSVDELIEPELAEIEARVDDLDRAERVLSGNGVAITTHRTDEGRLRIRARTDDLAAINAKLVRAEVAVSEFSRVRRTLEDYFMTHVEEDAS